MKIIQFRSRKERAFAELLAEAKQLGAQGVFMTTPDDEEILGFSDGNILPFPAGLDIDDSISEEERQEDDELAKAVLERQDDSEIEFELDQL